jgi:hypothetical protein
MAQALSYRPAKSASFERYRGKKQAAVPTDTAAPTDRKHIRGHGSDLRRDGERLARKMGHRVTYWEPIGRTASLTASRWLGVCDYCKAEAVADPNPPKIRTSQDYTGESWANAYREVQGDAVDKPCPHAEVLEQPAPTNKRKRQERYIKMIMSKYNG